MGWLVYGLFCAGFGRQATSSLFYIFFELTFKQQNPKPLQKSPLGFVLHGLWFVSKSSCNKTNFVLLEQKN